MSEPTQLEVGVNSRRETMRGDPDWVTVRCAGDGWRGKGSPLMTFPIPILVTKGFARSTDESNLNRQQRSVRVARTGDVTLCLKGGGCVSVLCATLKPTGVVHRDFITGLGAVNLVALPDNFPRDTHCCSSSWEKGFLTEAEEKFEVEVEVEVGSNWMIQFCEVGGSGDKDDRQSVFFEQWMLRGGRVVYIKPNLKKKKRRGGGRSGRRQYDWWRKT